MVRKGREIAAKREKNRGFTLLEVLVAVLILSLAYVAVLQNFSQSLANIFRLDSRRAADLEAVIDFSRQLRETEGESRSDLAGEVLVEGQKFVLKKIFSKDSRLETVVLERR